MTAILIFFSSSSSSSFAASFKVFLVGIQKSQPVTAKDTCMEQNNNDYHDNIDDNENDDNDNYYFISIYQGNR